MKVTMDQFVYLKKNVGGLLKQLKKEPTIKDKLSTSVVEELDNIVRALPLMIHGKEVPLGRGEFKFLSIMVDKSLNTLSNIIIPGYERRAKKDSKYKEYLDKANKKRDVLADLSVKLKNELKGKRRKER